MSSVVIDFKSLRAAKRFVEWFEELDDEQEVMRDLTEAAGFDCTVIDICIEGSSGGSDDFLFAEEEEDYVDEDDIDRQLRTRNGVRGNDWIL